MIQRLIHCKFNYYPLLFWNKYKNIIYNFFHSFDYVLLKFRNIYKTNNLPVTLKWIGKVESFCLQHW
ncbi:hypothetical protein T4D_4666 [Trichinella pseudospiralis]|uniref:Uncharacterized protein n=1 Tax=Trichinella pseudospiralis TaxID=6337 RepID=A0A0V1FT57_TRIPS|nr:hypothetical protein T4D_4666 [Trichinella pseudospiralis]